MLLFILIFLITFIKEFIVINSEFIIILGFLFVFSGIIFFNSFVTNAMKIYSQNILNDFRIKFITLSKHNLKDIIFLQANFCYNLNINLIYENIQQNIQKINEIKHYLNSRSNIDEIQTNLLLEFDKRKILKLKCVDFVYPYVGYSGTFRED